jgi:hypothetical protein
MLGLIILGIILLILLIVIVSNVKVVPQAHAYSLTILFIKDLPKIRQENGSILPCLWQ